MMPSFLARRRIKGNLTCWRARNPPWTAALRLGFAAIGSRGLPMDGSLINATVE